jgi:signal transduction histidine kinase/CHASE1-domain containing sensor protein
VEQRTSGCWNGCSARSLLIAAAYVTVGKLALLLSIPPGYATAIWPPAGIALGALLMLGKRAWPGVFLGSFLTNIATSFDGSSPASIMQSLSLPTIIGAGAALQAYMGTVLITYFFREQLRLNNERQVFGFFLLGGPIACWINASIGVSALASFGSIPASAMAFSWWTWWVGDSIGTLIFAPLILMWCGTDPAWRSRRVLVTVPLAGMLVAAILVFIYTSSAEWHDMEGEFERDAGDFADVVERRVALNAQNLRALSTLHSVALPVSERSFLRLSEPLIAQHAEVMEVGWAPRSGEQFPLLFSQARGASWPRGLDLQSITPVREALQRARRSGAATATLPFETATGISVLLIQPVHADGAPLQPGPSGDPLLGVLYLNLHQDTLFEPALGKSLRARRMELVAVDTADPAAAPIFEMRALARPPGKPLDLRADMELGIADRTWRLSFTPTLEFVSGDHAVIAWLVLAVGLLLSALVGAGALILTGRTSEVEALVAARTEELADINARLAEKICDHVRTEHALAGEKQFLSTVLENLGEGIVALNTAGKTTMANRAAKNIHQRITGARHSGTTWTRADIFFAPDTTTPIQARELPGSRALRGETVRDFEMISLVPGRASVTVLVSAQPLLDRDGVQTGIIKMIRDITEVRKADRLKREFVAVVSHELRTPLTSIRGSLGLVSGGTAGTLPDKARKLIDIAYRNSDRLAALINEILDIEKIESGKLTLASEQHSLRALVQQSIEANSGYAHECDVTLALQDGADDGPVDVDANRLLQVMANLLSNASKFSPRRATVDVAIELRAGRLRVSVRDQGPGIPEEFRPYMFQKFSQVDGSDSRAKPGTGLGLAICKGLIERMQGSIDYHLRDGGGTVFFFELPVAACASIHAATAPSLSHQGHPHG